jgi:hypothetical protein
MNDLLPRPWDAVAYGLVALISLVMLAAVILYLPYHCEMVYQQTGIQGACSLGAGWALFALAFLAIAAYAGWQLYNIRQEKDQL